MGEEAVVPPGRPALVGRRFISVTGVSAPRLSKLYEWDWRAGWIRSSSSKDPKDKDLQLLLEFDEQSWKERDWYDIYRRPSKESQKEAEKEKKKKRRKTSTDDEEEREEFQLFLVEERLTVAHRPNSQGSSATSGTLYPALVFKPLVDKVEIFKTKKLPVEFLSDNKLVFQEYSHLRTITKWDPTIPGLALCPRSEAEVSRWAEEGSGQSILLNTPSLLMAERVSIYRVEGTTQWYSAFIIAHCQETGEFTVTDDTVLEEHYENPDTVQMRILGEGVIEAILSGESLPVNPRRSRASAYRPQEKPRGRSTKAKSEQIKARRSSSASVSGKLQPRNKRRVSSESPKKKKSPPPPSPQHKKLKALTAAPSPKSPKSDKPPKSPKSDKPLKSEKVDKPPKSDKPIRLDKSDKPPKSDKSDKLPKSDKSDKLPKSDKSDKSPKSDKSDKSDKPAKSDKLDKPPKSDKSPKLEKSDKSPKSDKSDKPPQLTPPTSAPPSPPKSVSEDTPVPRAASPPPTKQSESEKLDKLLEKADGKSPSPQPIRLPTKSKSKPESDSDSDSRSTKSSASSTSKVARVFKKTFKGKAIAIVKPFSNPAPEKKSPDKEKKEPEPEPSSQAGDEYEFGEEEESGAVEGSSRRADSPGKPVKRLKGGKQLKSVRVRVEKLQGKKQSPRAGRAAGEKQKGEQPETVKEEEERTAEQEDGEEVIDDSDHAALGDTAVKAEADATAESEQESAQEAAGLGTNSEVKSIKPEVKAEGNDVKCEPPSEVTAGVSSSAKLGSVVNSLVVNSLATSHSLATALPPFPAPLPLAAKLGENKGTAERDEDRDNAKNRCRMEDDRVSDSGVSTLRSDGARSSGDERSGSRSSALSDDRSGSRPSASTSVEPDIKIVATVPGQASGPGPAQYRREAPSRGEQEAQEAARRQGDSLARQFQEASRRMADPRHAMGMHAMGPGMQHQQALQALASGHYPSPHGHLLPPGLQSSQALQQALQYQLAAAASLGISPEALFKGGGYPAPASHPGHDLLLERERQIAQERDRALRERRDQEQRERDRLDKERAERERREREDRERKERELREREKERAKMMEIQRQKEERERQAVEADVNRHFELSIELARKKMGSSSGSWSNLTGQSGKEEDYQDRAREMARQQYAASRAPPPAHGGPPPAHSAHAASPKTAGHLDSRMDPRYAAYPNKAPLPSPRSNPKMDHRVIPGAPEGFRADQQYGVSRVQSQSPGAYHRGPSPQHRGPSPHMAGPPSHHRGGPSPHRGGPSPHRGGPSPLLAHMHPAKSLSPHTSHLSPSEHYPPQPYPHSKTPVGYPAPQASPHGLPRPMAASPHLPPTYHMGPMVSPSAHSDPGTSKGPPPAHSKALPGQLPPQPLPWSLTSKPGHHSPRPTSATGSLPPANGDLVPLDLGSTKRKHEVSLAPESNLPQKSARLEPLSPPGQLHRVTEPSTLGSSVIAAEATPITSVVNTAVVKSEVIMLENMKSEEPEKVPEKKPDEFKYVHKLKKAWIQEFTKAEASGKTSTSTFATTSPNLTRATPSPEGSTKSCSSSKGGLPSAVKSAAESLKVNGHSGVEEENELDDFSSENDEKPVEKPKRGRPGLKPGPKPKGKPGPKPKQTPRKNLHSESDNNSDSEKDSDSSKTSKKSELLGGKKRGRKPGTKLKKPVEVDEPKNKKVRQEENSNPSEAFAKPSVTQLKKTGDSFLQSASCCEVAAKLNKCRECRMSQSQRQKQSMANIFCRFYAFRRLRYTKNGQIAQAGFCDPKQDAQIEDLKLWLPSQDLSPQNMDKETARTILTNLSSQFRTIYKQELEAETFAEDLTPAWKRVVQGVREMCDVCEATLFNKHWACGKCGFVVCIDCYRARVNNQPSPAVTVDPDAKDKDVFHWLLCNNNKCHQLDSLMLTQIIAGDALEEVSNRLGVLARLGKKSNGWKSPDKKPMANGIKDETDVKEDDEADDGKSSLRDLLGTEEDMSPSPEERQVLRMDLEETEAQFPGASHRWLCDKTVLRIQDPDNEHNISLFKLVWKRAQPVIVTGLADRLDARLWHSDTLAGLPDQTYDPATPDTSAISHGQSIKKFFDGFNTISKRPVTDAGEPMTLKFRENWPSQEDHFAELLPAQYKDLMQALPLTDYTAREGRLNLAARLPECFVRLDLGPRMWGGYSKATFNLQYNVADAVHIMVARGEARDLKGDLGEVLQSTGCDQASADLAMESPDKVGAIWHIFHPSQADKIKDFVMKNSKTDSKKKPKDPLWVGHMYLKERLLEKLEIETGIKPWSFVQSLGEGVIIPTGAPYQVKVLNSSLFCQSEFVSPEQMRQVMRLSFTDIGQQFDDRLQVKNVIFHSCKDALSILERPEKEDEEAK